MRRGLWLLLLAGCGSHPVVAKRLPAPPASIVVAPPPLVEEAEPPAVPLFSDWGQGATITLAPDVDVVLGPMGPGLIAVQFVDEQQKLPWKSIEVERHVIGEAEMQTDTFVRTKNYHPYRSNTMHTAEPGMLYEYHARLDNGAWSAPVRVRMGRPTHPPPPPRRLEGAAKDRYSIELKWDADLRAVTGYEIDVLRDGQWVLAAVSAAGNASYVHNSRLPDTTYEYRIAAFNQNGKSPFVRAVVKTPSAPISVPNRKPPVLAPCTKLGPDASSLAVDMMGLLRHDLTMVKGVTLISEPVKGNPSRRVLYGEYKGCLREMGRFDLQGDAFTALAWTDEGYPLLRGVLGAGEYVGAAVGLFAHVGGRYEQVNAAGFCGSPDPNADPKDPKIPYVIDEKALTLWRGPIESCQRDFPQP